MAGEDGPYKGRGIYPVTSLLNHACITNTRNIVTGRTLEVGLSIRAVNEPSRSFHSDQKSPS